MVGGEVVARAVAFIATAYLSRRLGPAGFGLVGFATAFTLYFGLVVSGGMAVIGAREVARDPAAAPDLVSGIGFLRVSVAAVCFLLLWIVAGFAGLSTDEQLLVRLSGLTLFSLALDVSWAYKGLERGARVAVAAVAGQTGMLCAILLLVRTAADVRWVPVSQFFGEGFAALVLFVPLVIRARHLALAAAVKLFRSATLPGITRLSRALIFTFDVLLLGFLSQRAELGLYTAAYRVCLLVLAVQVALHSSYWAAGARAETPSLLGDVVTRAIGVAGAVGLPLVVGGMVLARPLMMLLFGSAYAPGAPMLAWLLVSIGCTLGHGAYTAALIAAGAARREFWIMATAAFVNVAANLMVIPTYGALGAAIVTALSEGVALVLCVISGHRAGWGVRFRALGPSVAAAAAMAAVLLPMRDHVAVLVCVLLGGAVYLGALLLFGVPEDARPLVASVRANARRLILPRSG